MGRAMFRFAKRRSPPPRLEDFFQPPPREEEEAVEGVAEAAEANHSSSKYKAGQWRGVWDSPNGFV